MVNTLQWSDQHGEECVEIWEIFYNSRYIEIEFITIFIVFFFYPQIALFRNSDVETYKYFREL